jgi:hypothetical protein
VQARVCFASSAVSHNIRSVLTHSFFASLVSEKIPLFDRIILRDKRKLFTRNSASTLIKTRAKQRSSTPDANQP